MTLRRLVVIVALPAYVLAGVFAGLALIVPSVARMIREDWRESA